MDYTKDGPAFHKTEKHRVLSEAEHSKIDLNQDQIGSISNRNTAGKETNKRVNSETGKPFTKPQQKSSRKENFCLTHYAEGNMSKTMPAASNKKFPPFRTGKYVPKDNVYSSKGISEKFTALKSKTSSNKEVLAMSCPLPFRGGKLLPSDLHDYADISNREAEQKSLKVKDKSNSPGLLQKSRNTSENKQGRFSPDFHRANKSEPFYGSNCRSSSLERVSHIRKPVVNTLKAINKISLSDNSVYSKTIKAQPSKKVRDHFDRTRTCSENSLNIPKARPKSSVLELSSKSSASEKSLKEASNPFDKMINVTRAKYLHRPKSTNLEVINKGPKRTTTSSPKGRPKSYVVQTVLGVNNESRRYLRKSSDTSSHVSQRPKSVILNTSNSDRTCSMAKPCKARRVPRRNIYVTKQKRCIRKKPPLKSKLEQNAESHRELKKSYQDETDGLCNQEVYSHGKEKSLMYDIFMDKFCVKVRHCGKQVKIPALRRCRLMLWKIKRISYIFYEKVLFFLLCSIEFSSSNVNYLCSC